MVNYTEDFTNLTDLTRYMLTAVDLTILLIGIPGNLFLFFSSHIHQALNVEDVTRLIIEHVAVCDVLLLVLNFLPILTTLIHHSWVLGTEICYFVSFTVSILFFYEVFLTVFLSVRRLTLIWGFAKTNGRLSVNATKVILAVIFLISAAPSLSFVGLGCSAFFAPHTLMCVSSQYKEYPLASLVLIGVYLVIPVAILVIINMLILLYLMCKSSTSTSNKGFTMTIISLIVASWIFVFSYIPIFVKLTMLTLLKVTVTYTFQITQQFILATNLFLNPVIYGLFNRRFRRFIVSYVGEKKSFLSRTISNSFQ